MACDPRDASSRLTRRHFVGGAAATLGALSAVSTFSAAGASAAKTSSKSRASPPPRTLIWLELKGGNDGLAMFAPVGQRRYRQLRPDLGRNDNDGFSIAPGLLAHPGLLPLTPALEAGEWATVVDVGPPQKNRSHFRAIELWDQLTVGDELRDQGWLASALPLARAAHRLPAAGPDVVDGLVFRGDEGPLAGALALHLQGAAQGRQRRRAGRLTPRPAVGASPATSPPTSSAIAHIEAVRAQTARLEQAMQTSLMSVTVPSVPRADGVSPMMAQAVQLAAAAAILGATSSSSSSPSPSTSAPVVKFTLPGFDTHTRQRAAHDKRMAELGAFLGQLRATLVAADAWQHTVVVVMSEFGRRAQENGNGGTDHGAAGPVLVLGGAVRGGLVGTPSPLDDLDDGGDLRIQHEHRALMPAVFAGTFGVDVAAVHQALGVTPSRERAPVLAASEALQRRLFG